MVHSGNCVHTAGVAGSIPAPPTSPKINDLGPLSSPFSAAGKAPYGLRYGKTPPKIAGFAVLLAAACLSACSTGRGYLRADLVAEDLPFYEVDIEAMTTTAVSRNPKGRVAIGYEVEPHPQLAFSVELAHQSSVHTGKDRGINSASISVRWYFTR